MNILLTGGCGYVGTLLTKKLLNLGHKVTVVDTQWFGNFLKRHKNLKMCKKDIRNLNIRDFKNIDSVIHLANIANDPAVDLNHLLSWDVNVQASKLICDLAVKTGVKQLIFGSSGSVYGVKKEKKVTEDLDLLPISTYNKTKMISERVLMSYSKHFKIHCIRPATVCGISDRMRLDLSVNMLAFQALKRKKITVFGGNQIRPNIHIKDMVNVYLHFLKKNNLPSGFYNAGFENLKIINIAKKITKKISSSIIVSKSNDRRSYRLDSTKLVNSGFTPEYTVDDAIEEIIENYRNGLLKDNKRNYTVSWMKKIKVK